MKHLKVTVNGKSYDVSVEEVSANAATSAPVVENKVAAPAVQTTAAPAVPANAASGEGEAINCPMPGTILSINVKAGDPVKKGDVLLILEAMKMENEITAPKDGIITSITCTKGESVESGKALATIK